MTRLGSETPFTVCRHPVMSRSPYRDGPEEKGKCAHAQTVSPPRINVLPRAVVALIRSDTLSSDRNVKIDESISKRVPTKLTPDDSGWFRRAVAASGASPP